MLHEKITLPRTGVILKTYLADEKSLKQSISAPSRIVRWCWCSRAADIISCRTVRLSR